MRTVPVNQSAGPFPEAWEPTRLISIGGLYWMDRGGAGGRRKGVPSVFFLGGEGLGYLA